MDVYQIVTDRIMSELQKGVVPWKKPWVSLNGGAYNRVTGRRYSTLNQLLLMHDGPYASFDQWNKLGGTIRKGEKSEIVVFWKMPEAAPEDAEEEQQKKPRPVLRYYRVFHESQVDGITRSIETMPAFDTAPDEKAEMVFQNYLDLGGVKLQQEMSDKAYYSPEQDLIHLPLLSQFKDEAEYYSTVFHEAVHSSGHSRRLNRIGIQKSAFGDAVYSKEELIAEIGAACMLQTLGLGTEESICNNAAYVYGWLKALKDDSRLITSAAGQAEKAVRFILDCSKFDQIQASST